MSKQEQKGLSRRTFLKGTGLTAAAAGATLLGYQSTAAQDGGPVVMNAELATQKWSFEIPPDPIPESDIASTVEGDVVIVGAGIAGLVCACSAAENGAKVVLISASKAPVYRGGSFHSGNSRFKREHGVEPYDVDTFYRQELSAAGYLVDQAKWWKFYNNSEEAVNWLDDKMEAAGFTPTLEVSNTEPNNGPMNTPHSSHAWLNADNPMTGMSAGPVANILEQSALASGVEFHYKTVAKQLIREDNNTGRVTAVIAVGEDGSYTKYAGAKAVVLATGDFSTDKEMMTKYCPSVLPLLNDAGDQGYDNLMKMGGLFPGDGHKMGLWIGAAWQKAATPPMVMGGGAASTQPYGGHRGLVMNKLGLRYGNEDVNGCYAGYQQMRQPEMKAFAIWGTNYAEDGAPWHTFGQKYDDPPVDPANILTGWQTSAQNGALVTGDTIEEVIEKLGLPADVTKATVDQYNAYCEAGVDDEFHKRAELLVPIAEAPFYGAAFGAPSFLTVMGGLRTNINMQVCDENDAAIPGLYNLGTMVGDYFANVYNFKIEGNNLGANCLTFGYMTGRDIANGTLA